MPDERSEVKHSIRCGGKNKNFRRRDGCFFGLSILARSPLVAKQGQVGDEALFTTLASPDIPYPIPRHHTPPKGESMGQTDGGASVLTRSLLPEMACDRPRFPWDLVACSLAPLPRAVGDYRGTNAAIKPPSSLSLFLFRPTSKVIPKEDHVRRRCDRSGALFNWKKSS